jgi:hypothetical protein
LPICAEQEPELREVGPGHRAACHFAKPYPIDVSKLDQKVIDEDALRVLVGSGTGSGTAGLEG